MMIGYGLLRIQQEECLPALFLLGGLLDGFRK
jgi:hypothetical protein